MPRTNGRDTKVMQSYSFILQVLTAPFMASTCQMSRSGARLPHSQTDGRSPR